MAMQPTVSQLTLTSSYQPQFSYTSNTHVHRFPFRPTDRPTDRPLCSYRHKFLHNYLDAAATHLQPKTKSQPPPPSLPSSSELSLSLSRLPKLILSPLPKIRSLKTGGTSPKLNQLKNAFLLFSPTPSLNEKKTAHLAHPLGPQNS